MNGKITHYHIFVLSQQFGKTQTGQSGLNHRVWYLLCFFPMDDSFVPPCLKISGLEMGAIPGPHTQMKNGPLEFLRKVCTKSWLISAVFFIYEQFYFLFLPQSWSLTLLAALNMWSSFLKRHTVTLLLGQSHTVFSKKEWRRVWDSFHSAGLFKDNDTYEVCLLSNMFVLRGNGWVYGFETAVWIYFHAFKGL